MLEKNTPFIEEVVWENVRETVANTCKKLSTIIDTVSPGKEYPLLRVHYPFDTKILEKTLFHLPNNYGFSVPITDIKNIQKIREQLNYSPVPLSIIIKNNIEMFHEIDDKIFCKIFLQ